MPAIINLILTYKYIIILPMAIIEGPFLAVLMGYLVYASYLNVFLTFFVLLLGDIGPDIFYWRLGRYGNKKILESKYFSSSGKIATHLDTLENMWHKHTKKTMFFGKIAYGISVPIIISAGIAKLPLKRFVLVSLPVGMSQIALLMLLGYHLGTSYEVASKYVTYPGIIVAILIAIGIVIYIFFAKHFAKLFNKDGKKNEN